MAERYAILAVVIDQDESLLSCEISGDLPVLAAVELATSLLAAAIHQRVGLPVESAAAIAGQVASMARVMSEAEALRRG